MILQESICDAKLISTGILLCFIIPSLAQSPGDLLFSRNRSYQTMAERWELDDSTRRGTFLITPYKPVFITAGRWSSNPTSKPTSENPLYTFPFRINYNKYECKFQLSFKAKIVQGVFKNHMDVWIAYTQKAHWQIYNSKLSRPFRELNYEPEAIVNFPVNFPFLGFRGRMLGIIFNHQSNGRSLPWSRSWNRIILQAGFEREHWQVFLRPWIRLQDEEDENPAITDYIGRGEAVVVRNFGKHQLSLIGTHSLRLGSKNRGSIQGMWVFPVTGNIKGQLLVSNGYGETLMDYNHRQTTIGVSISLMEW